MHRTTEPAVQDFIKRTIQTTPPDLVRQMFAEQMRVGSVIWTAAYDQALQDHKVGPYAETAK